MYKRQSLDRVRVLVGEQVIANHARTWDKGQVVEDQTHIEALKQQKRAAGQHGTLEALSREVPAAKDFLEHFLRFGGNVGRATQTLWQLSQTYGSADLQQALIEALSQDRIRVGDVQILLERRRHPEQPPERLSLKVNAKLAGKKVRLTPIEQYADLTRRPS